MNILIIGAGPIGLYMGLILKNKKNKDNYNVTILEKRNKYTRENVCGLLVKQLKPIIPVHIYNKIRKYSCYRKIGNKKCYLQELDIIVIPLKILESILYNECIKLNIKFIYDDKHENYLNNINIIFLATGTSNKISEELIQTRYIQQTEYYGMGMFFKSNKYREYKKAISNKEVKIKSNRYRIFPVKKPNRTYMGISISKEEHDILEEKYSTLRKENKYININTIPKKIKSIIINGLNYYNFQNISDTNIFPIKFGIKYNSKVIDEIIYNKKKILVCLIGNQVYNHHFFAGKGIITGFTSSFYLNNLISTDYENGYKKNIIKKYKIYINKLRREEWNEYPDMIVPFKEVEDLIKNIPKKDLDRIGKTLNIPYYRINKTELAYVLGCKYIEGCIGNKFAKA
jgi:hypothetical protein